tara:strand:- start:4556 stop:5128 length:573 start_codon:yes stop_codon:yes gene_type:complete
MKNPNAFIIRLPEKFKSELELGDVNILLVSKFQEFENRHMEAKIVSLPVLHDTGAKVGDTLYFHHHVVLNAHFDIGDDLYLVPFHPMGGRNNLANAFKNEEGIHLLADWVFMEPMESSKKMKSDLIELLPEDAPNDHGRIKYPSEALEEMDIHPGDVVYFSKNSDYEMEVDGEKLWRMMTSDLEYAEIKN